MANDIPECVLESLEVVRSDGATNMMAREVVIMLVGELCDDDEAVALVGAEQGSIHGSTQGDGCKARTLNGTGGRA